MTALTLTLVLEPNKGKLLRKNDVGTQRLQARTAGPVNPRVNEAFL